MVIQVWWFPVSQYFRQQKLSLLVMPVMPVCCRKPSWKDGTTAVVVLVLNNTLYIANLGDSKVINTLYIANLGDSEVINTLYIANLGDSVVINTLYNANLGDSK